MVICDPLQLQDIKILDINSISMSLEPSCNKEIKSIRKKLEDIS